LHILDIADSFVHSLFLLSFSSSFSFALFCFSSECCTGDTWRNGQLVKEGEEVTLKAHDRVGMGDQLMMLRWPGREEGMRQARRDSFG
jgi:hypothetical protein